MHKLKNIKLPFMSKRIAKTGGRLKTDDDHVDDEMNPSPLSPTGLLSLKNLPQPQWMTFEDANGWEPEEHVVMYCLNGQDNVPTRVKLENDFVYYVSQNRSPGHKDQGQDCMAYASQGNWEVHLLCDGHDKAGHMVALGICQQLPRIVLRKITERNGENPGGVDEPISDKIVNDSFDECARVVCWTKDGITVGLWVKVFDGQWADKPGFIKESNGQGKVKVAIIDENGYHLPSLDKASLRRPRFTGGCTCCLLIRNKVTKECKVAVSGDSRMLVLPAMGVNDAILIRQPGLEEKDGSCPEGLITPAHNVFNEEEKERLARDFSGQYEFDGNFLVNPITKFAIQPTRGFGDFDMFGTGYTHFPEITKTFKMEPDGLILTASDGLFDTHVWADEEIVTCLNNFMKDGLTNVQIIDRMYRETLERSHEGGYVDDISIYCFREPGATPTSKKEVDIVKDKDLPKEKKTKMQKKSTKQDRRTIGRGANDFSNLNEKLQDLKQQRESEKNKKEENVAEILKDNDEVMDGMGEVMNKMAKSSKMKKDIDAKAFLAGQALTEEEDDV